MSSRGIIRKLQQAGWVVARVTGSHHMMSDGSGKVVPVPHPKKDLPLGTIRAIERSTGVKLR